jgi:hypothetical protein
MHAAHFSARWLERENGSWPTPAAPFFPDMLINTIGDLNRAVPFQPYEIRTNGGERLMVPHRDFILVAPNGGWVIVTDEQDRPRHISSILIEEVAPVRNKRAPRKRKSRS